eukprot:TRINITY_DN108_c3_g1_i1.p1 TRINITY_DN108_c3_g1~~TRINITY_DN108_c3_g1_i1.p1  ORF type:complete len:272 (-),score=64.85 TRINITY_DN108_c3_g1_i1:305-1120(-)
MERPVQAVFAAIPKVDNNPRRGRRKIKIEYIKDKSRRHITFSKRKAGIMKKAYELAVLTGTQVLLLVASETGHVYTFATPKLQPLITEAEGKNLIQQCLNTPDDPNAQTEEPPSPPSELDEEEVEQLKRMEAHDYRYGAEDDSPGSDLKEEEFKFNPIPKVEKLNSHDNIGPPGYANLPPMEPSGSGYPPMPPNMFPRTMQNPYSSSSFPPYGYQNPPQSSYVPPRVFPGHNISSGGGLPSMNMSDMDIRHMHHGAHSHHHHHHDSNDHQN